MARPCTICRHPDREVIDSQIVQGGSLRGIARHFAVGDDAITRHAKSHIAPMLVKAQAIVEVTQADSLLDGMRSLQSKTLAMLDSAQTAKDLRTALMAVGEARRNFDLLARLLGELDERPQINILVSPEWQQLRGVILQALAPYPEARTALASVLTGAGNG